jgi:hypothetical protein
MPLMGRFRTVVEELLFGIDASNGKMEAMFRA